MLEHAIYTVASPEASASILGPIRRATQDAATSTKITAQDLFRFGIITVPFRSRSASGSRPGRRGRRRARAIGEALKSLENMSSEALREARAEKYLAIGRRV